MSNEPRECRYCYGTGIDTTDSVCACVRYPLKTEVTKMNAEYWINIILWCIFFACVVASLAVWMGQ
jgi:hypothetical protein